MKWFKNPRLFLSTLAATICLFGIQAAALAQQAQEPLKPYIDTVQQSQTGMTLWEMLKAGGVVMLILLGVSILTITLIVYNYLTVREKKVAPRKFAEDALQAMERNDEQKLESLCRSEKNIFSVIIQAGLEKRKRGPVFAKEAMENAARNEVTTLWQNLSYLADIATIAPLIGLLGTVLGMIQAFNVIAFQTMVVKPILLAGGVSKAMVTTAGGLIVAIPALIFYSYFKVKVQDITNTVDNYTQDMIKVLTKDKAAAGRGSNG